MKIRLSRIARRRRRTVRIRMRTKMRTRRGAKLHRRNVPTTTRLNLIATRRRQIVRIQTPPKTRRSAKRRLPIVPMTTRLSLIAMRRLPIVPMTTRLSLIAMRRQIARTTMRPVRNRISRVRSPKPSRVRRHRLLRRARSRSRPNRNPNRKLSQNLPTKRIIKTKRNRLTVSLLLNCRRASPDQSGGRPSICSSPATFPPHVTRSRRSSRENVRRSVGRFERKSARANAQ